MVTRSKAPASTKHRVRPAPIAPSEPPDPVPDWPQLKLDIVRRYGAAYSTIASRQPGLAHYWIDGFTRPGTGVPAREFVPGSPFNALLVSPPFHHHYLVNMGSERAGALGRAVEGRADVTLLEGGGSRALLEDVLPRVRQEDYRRALCVLDPCELDWRVIETAGRLRTIDLFVAFADAPGHTPQALRRRLREDAGFANVLDPLPLCDRAGRTTTHVVFASRNSMANGVVEDIFTTYRDGGAQAGEARG